MNGGAGLRLCLRVPTFVTRGSSSRSAAAWRAAVASSPTSRAAPSIRTSSAAKTAPSAVARSASIVQYSRAVNARDLALALDDEPDGDRLDPAGRQARADLAAQERAQGVADEAVDDPPGLLGVDEVRVDVAGMGEGVADRALGDLVEGHPMGLRGRHVGGLGDVPGDRLALPIEVGGEPHVVGDLDRLGDLGELLAAVVRDDVFRGEVMVDVDAELALAGVLGQVADMAVGGEDLVVGAQVAFDRPRLGGRFDDHEVL